MLIKLYSKSFKQDFNSMWTGNFQLYKLGLEKAEEPEIKLQHSLNHRESKGIPEKNISLIDYV